MGFVGYTIAEGLEILANSTLTTVKAEPERQQSIECFHRGELLRVDKCDLCSMKGQPMDVFSCKLHGECSLRRQHSGIKACLSCEDRHG